MNSLNLISIVLGFILGLLFTISAVMNYKIKQIKIMTLNIITAVCFTLSAIISLIK